MFASFVSIAFCVDAADVDCNQMAGFCQFGTHACWPLLDRSVSEPTSSVFRFVCVFFASASLLHTGNCKTDGMRWRVTGERECARDACLRASAVAAPVLTAARRAVLVANSQACAVVKEAFAARRARSIRPSCWQTLSYRVKLTATTPRRFTSCPTKISRKRRAPLCCRSASRCLLEKKKTKNEIVIET